MLRMLCLGLLFLAFLPACKEKKIISLSGDEPVEAEDFIAFFQPLSLPFQYADSTLRKNNKENDSLLISHKVFSGLMPDTILTRIYGKNVKPKIYAMGKTTGPNNEHYLLIKTAGGNKRAVIVLGFNKNKEYGAALTALRPDLDASTQQSFTIDRRHTISQTVLRKNKNGTLSEGRDVYAFNADSKLFYLVMTDALEDKPTELINPIDTLPRKNKWSADYTAGKMNLVSIRDGRRNNKLTFFIHFERNNRECTGELKGEAAMTSPTTAEYRQDGDPCKLKFIFTSSSVTLKEIEGCGSYRPLKCSFDGSFAKKKEPRAKTTKGSSGKK
ncbi:MAG: hypothetical protein FJY20_02335 [Bacteroidetes bacterium]|nr:hypothetical protein [Bacteroidota bacterium]